MNADIPRRILVVDDDHDVLYTAKLVLRGMFETIDTLDSPGLIPVYLKKNKYDAILLDLNFTRGSTTGREGMEWLGKILQIDPEARILITTAYGEINLAVQAMKAGAVDFIIKPWNKERLVTCINNSVNSGGRPGENRKVICKSSGKENSGKSNYPDIISRSSKMAQIKETIKTVAPTDANILILGENGTGKELTALALHCESLRNEKDFVHVDLGAIPETLFEAELFGHTRGAFTDAKEERAGRFETASGGTLFLDEIGNLSLPLQAKILSAVQNRAVVRIGSNNQVPVNIRLICATNMPLYQMAESFDFRQDLLYRINTIEIEIPPLRERKEDISLIADHYLKVYSKTYGKEGITFKEDTIYKLEKYQWPGNIRELAHAVERAVILCKGYSLTPDDFILKIKSLSLQKTEEHMIRVDDYEKKAINNALELHDGNLSKAANDLGIARSTLYRKIAHFGIEN